VIIDEWIETAKELGRPVPQLKGPRLMYTCAYESLGSPD
jgi:hypothetical protein